MTFEARVAGAIGLSLGNAFPGSDRYLDWSAWVSATVTEYESDVEVAGLAAGAVVGAACLDEFEAAEERADAALRD